MRAHLSAAASAATQHKRNALYTFFDQNNLLEASLLSDAGPLVIATHMFTCGARSTTRCSIATSRLSQRALQRQTGRSLQ
jgi:Mn2+/Fe2+ NRAMP family transporter